MVIDESWLPAEPERTLYAYCFAWEGEREQIRRLDGVTVHELPVPLAGHNGMVVGIMLDGSDVDARLDRLLDELETGDRHFVWIVGPSTRPTDLARRLEARGLTLRAEWDGMTLDSISAEDPEDDGIIVEPLSPENAEEYALISAEGAPADVRNERLAAARRYLCAEAREVEIFIGRLEGRAISTVILRIEPNGVAYLRNAYTLSDARGRGAYSSLVTYRLQAAHRAGCRYAVVQANRQTSSPILARRGFRAVYPIYGYMRPAP